MDGKGNLKTGKKSGLGRSLAPPFNENAERLKR
jgi:hypothetical protein